MLCFKGEYQMLKWLCYDDSAIFYVVATTREEAAAFAAQYDGHVVCVVPVATHSGVRAG
jgi:hypothetical protein